jgi:hypothetical protein
VSKHQTVIIERELGKRKKNFVEKYKNLLPKSPKISKYCAKE